VRSYSHLSRLLGFALFLFLACIAVVPLLSRGINPYDEGVVALGAEQILHGRRPAVDFYTPYGPGVFYTVAAAYRLFGTRLLVERWIAGLLIIFTGVFAYLLLIGRTRASSTDAARPNGDTQPVRHPELFGAVFEGQFLPFFTGLLIVLMLVCGWWYTPLNGGALALMMLAGLALQRGLVTGSPGWATAAGVVIGLTLLWRLTFGGALLIASSLTWILTVTGDTAADRERDRRSGLLAMVAAAAAIAVPVYAGLIHAGGERALKSLLVWPLTSTGAADLGWPPFRLRSPSGSPALISQLADATHGAPYYYGIAAVALILLRLPLGALTAADRQLGLWLLILLVPMFVYANGRTDYTHITPLLTFSLLLAALAIASGLSVRDRRRPAGWKAFGLLIWSASVLLLVPTVLMSWPAIRWSAGRGPLELPGPRGAGVYAPYRFSRNYRALVPMVHHHVAPAQAIFSGTRRHDVFLTNDTLIYFLAERRPATFYWCLDANLTTSVPVQEEMVSELARGGVAAAVIWTAPAPTEQNRGSQSSGVLLLDEWLKREFEPIRLTGLQYDLWVRKGLAGGR
jgi:hypothetical protein